MSEVDYTSDKKRHRFRWSLRTILIVVTLIACWLGYAMNWKQRRQAFREQSGVSYEFNSTPPSVINRWNNRLPVFAPVGLWLLGERGVVSVWLSPNAWSAEAQADAERLFPEARIMKVDRGNWVSVRPAIPRTLPWTTWLPRDPALWALGAAGLFLLVGLARRFRLRKRHAMVGGGTA